MSQKHCVQTAKRSRRPSGYILYQDDVRVVIVTGVNTASSNEKTGSMLQVWILVKAVDPITANRTGADIDICGTCSLRGIYNPETDKVEDRPCYVRLDTAPLGIWRGFHRGIYPYLPQSRYADVFVGRVTRWGAYGDPYFIPLSIVRWASFLSDSHTGYTHQWIEASAQDFKSTLMASVDNEQQAQQAHAMGWRTFRVRSKGAPILPGEITCPASKEATKARIDRYTANLRAQGFEGPAAPCDVHCETCRLCDGASGRSAKSIVIQAHGGSASKFDLIQIGNAA